MDRTLAELFDRAMARLVDGSLPPASNQISSGYIDNAATCALCEKNIESKELAFEVDLKKKRRRNTLVFHADCHAAWQYQSNLYKRRQTEGY
jgi:hypothetical protein